MAKRRVGGIILLKVDGEVFQAKGEFTYNINPVKRDTVLGSDRIHGYKEEPSMVYLEGAITDNDELNVESFQAITDATITLELANEKVIVFRNAWYASDGDISTGEGEIQCRFEAMSAEEVR